MLYLAAPAIWIERVYHRPWLVVLERFSNCLSNGFACQKWRKDSETNTGKIPLMVLAEWGIDNDASENQTAHISPPEKRAIVRLSWSPRANCRPPTPKLNELMRAPIAQLLFPQGCLSQAFTPRLLSLEKPDAAWGNRKQMAAWARFHQDHRQMTCQAIDHVVRNIQLLHRRARLWSGFHTAPIVLPVSANSARSCFGNAAERFYGERESPRWSPRSHCTHRRLSYKNHYRITPLPGKAQRQKCFQRTGWLTRNYWYAVDVSARDCCAWMQHTKS